MVDLVPDVRRRRRRRVTAAWLVALALAGGYLLVGDDIADDAHVETAASADGTLDIVEVIPNVPAPGSAVEVRFSGGDVGSSQLRAQLTQKNAAPELRTELAIIHRQDERIVVRLPRDARVGTAKLRLVSGVEGSPHFQRSKPYDLRVQPLGRRKLFRDVVGGVALLVLGLLTISSGTRAWADQRGQGLVARVARGTPAALGLGALVGGLTQFTTTAAGLVMGLVQAHLLAVAPALAVLIGAQLGAAATPALAGLASAREGLLVVAVGVFLIVLADDRRGRALANMVLGCGFLVFGLHLVRSGAAPLVADPEILPYLDLFAADTATGLLRCAAAGVLLGAALQGPVPIYVLVLGLAQASGRVSLHSALVVLGGTGLGAATATLALALVFGAEARRLARLHLLLAGAGSLLLMATAGWLAGLTERLVSGEAQTLAFGQRILAPHFERHLLVGSILGQLIAAALLGALIPLVARLGRRTPSSLAATHGGGTVRGAPAAVREDLGAVLAMHREALDGILALCLSGHRARGTGSEHALADARGQLERLFAGAVRSRSHEPELARLRQAALGTLQLQRGIEDLLRQAEASMERNMALLPPDGSWRVGPGDKTVLEGLHALLTEGLSELTQQLTQGGTPDLDRARAREIQINAIEMETRRALIDDAERGEASRAIALRLTNTDLVNAYEHVGNHVYRLTESLAAEVDQDLAWAV